MAGRIRRDRVIDAMLGLAAERPWNEVTLAAISERSGVKLVDIRREFRSRDAILWGFFDRIDAETLEAAADLEAADPVRDRVFDLVMRRFDALTPHRAAIRNIVDGLAREPGMALFTSLRLVNVQAWILEAAGGSAGGLIGRLRVNGLAAIYARAFRVWLWEDDPGLPRTMATLDRALRRGERCAELAEPLVAFADGLAGLAMGVFGRGRRRSPTAPPAGDGGTPSEA